MPSKPSQPTAASSLQKHLNRPRTPKPTEIQTHIPTPDDFHLLWLLISQLSAQGRLLMNWTEIAPQIGVGTAEGARNRWRRLCRVMKEGGEGVEMGRRKAKLADDGEVEGKETRIKMKAGELRKRGEVIGEKGMAKRNNVSVGFKKEAEQEFEVESPLVSEREDKDDEDDDNETVFGSVLGVPFAVTPRAVKQRKKRAAITRDDSDSNEYFHDTDTMGKPTKTAGDKKEKRVTKDWETYHEHYEQFAGYVGVRPNLTCPKPS